jgi:hypothetical protein
MECRLETCTKLPLCTVTRYVRLPVPDFGGPEADTTGIPGNFVLLEKYFDHIPSHCWRPHPELTIN